MILSQVEALNAALTQIVDMDMPFSVSYKFSKLLSQTQKDFEFYTKKLHIIIDKYAKRDENGEYIQKGDNIQLQQEFIQDAQRELDELGNIETEGCNVTFTLAELEDLKISPRLLTPLLPFIEE